jgi:hypothetical protein
MDGIPLGTSYTWLDARARGATRRQIVEDGVELARGLYLSRSVPATLARRCRAWTHLLPDAVFGLQTAGALLGAPVDPPSAIQVVLSPRAVRPERAGLEVHIRHLHEDDVITIGDLRITSGAQTFLDLAARLPAAELVACGDALMRRGHLTAEVLSARLARADGVRGVVRARACGPLLSPKAMSRPESLMRYWVVDAGLPIPEAQLPIRNSWGHVVAHADLGYEEWKVALEYEGRQHSVGKQFGQDIDRYSLMAADGWLTLRFAGRHLTGPGAVVDRTRRALLSRGWRP